MKKRQQWLEEMSERYGDFMKMDGYDACIIGVGFRFGAEPHLVYDYSKVLAHLMKDGMTEAEAVEFHEFNQAGAWMGDSTPAFLIKP